MNSSTLLGMADGLLDLPQLDQLVQPHGPGCCGSFRDLQLHSAFQPIYSLAHRRAVGFEALLRPRRGDAQLSPLAVFDMVQSQAEGVLLDRLCRMVHLRNFLNQEQDECWLFLNVNPMVTEQGKRYGRFFSNALAHYRIPPHRVVIEILEEQISDEGALTEAIRYYRELGCLVAIDDFGAGHSNFDRIWRIRPDIVKLDRSIIAQATGNRAARRMIPNLCNLIHEAGSLVLMEGIETEAEALIAMDSDVDFVQGYYFARPAALLPPPGHGRDLIDALHARSAEAVKQESGQHKQLLGDYLDAFEVLAKHLRAEADTGAACSNFLGLPLAERCYLLDKRGGQIGENILADADRRRPDPRFHPLTDCREAIWARRHYFRRAMARPGEVQVSQPYLSIAGGTLCVTLSVAVFLGKEVVVICGDLAWHER